MGQPSIKASPQVNIEKREKISPLAITIIVPANERKTPVMRFQLMDSLPKNADINMTSTGFKATIRAPWLA